MLNVPFDVNFEKQLIKKRSGRMLGKSHGICIQEKP